MQEIKDNNEEKKPKKSILYYYIVALIIIMLLNAFLVPSITRNGVVDVSYTDFLSMIEKNQVTQVAYDEAEKTYTFLATPEGSVRSIVFRTGVWPGDGERLLEQLRNTEGVQVAASIPTQANPILSFLLSWILPIVFIMIIGNLISRMMMKKMGGSFGNAMQFGKSGAKIYVKGEDQAVTFKDVAGEEEAKESLKEVVSFLHSPEKYREIGARLPKGILLVGPPGTGKTLLAKAVAGEAQVPFFSISGSEFVEMFVGMGAAKVRDLFKQANEKAPCIIFIDEIDAIGKKRDTSGFSSNDEREQTLNQLLAEMDGFDSAKGVVMLAATNRPESLDPALLRPGRFDRRVPVELPDLEGRKAILQVHAKDVKMDHDVDLEKIARLTSGASGAELANIINEGALLAIKRGHSIVTQSDLEESVETVIAGAEKKSRVVPEREKRIVAYHETGHALVAAIQTDSAPVTKITIIPRANGALGYTMQVDEGEKFLMSKAEILNKIATLTAGRAAEEIVFGEENATTGASNDIETATKLARAMITRYGMSDEFGMVALESVRNQYLGQDASLLCADDTSSRIDALVFDVVKKAHDKATKILNENRELLDELASYLLEKETITGDEFMEILKKKGK